jgi:hypothetical protein
MAKEFSGLHDLSNGDGSGMITAISIDEKGEQIVATERYGTTWDTNSREKAAEIATQRVVD